MSILQYGCCLFMTLFVSCSMTQYDLTMEIVRVKKESDQRNLKTSVPPLPDLAINNSTLDGVDSNNDSIRDDVENWIEFTANDNRQKWAMREYAKAIKLYSEFFFKMKSDEESKHEKAQECLVQEADMYLRNVFTSPRLPTLDLAYHISQKIEDLTFNTKLRTRKKIRFDFNHAKSDCDKIKSIQFYKN